MTQAAAIIRSVLTTPAPKTASPKPTVNAWVPAPSASAYARVIQARCSGDVPATDGDQAEDQAGAHPELASNRVTQRMSPVPSFRG